MKSLSDRPTFLIADLHLEAGCPEKTQLFLDFLAGPALEASTLYILGDLFEVWIGDDGPPEPATPVAQALHSLSSTGVGICFLCGNRDFLLGDAWCAQGGIRRLEEPVYLPDTLPTTALLHGDSLCTDDLDYQRFRAKVRDPVWQQRTLSKPLWWRKLLARFARTVSRRRNRSKPPEIMDVNSQAVLDTFQRLKVNRLIHGHTHRPAIHRLMVNGKPAIRVVLGDWHSGRGSVVRIGTDGEIELIKLGYDASGTLELKTLDREQAQPADSGAAEGLAPTGSAVRR